MHKKYVLMLGVLGTSIISGMDDSLENKVITAVRAQNVTALEQLAGAGDAFLAVINKAMVSITTDSGKRMKVTPVVYAVWKQSVPLLSGLLKVGAVPYGIGDMQEGGLGTPVQEAVRLQNKELISQLKKAWLTTLAKATEHMDELIKQLMNSIEDRCESNDFLPGNEVQNPFVPVPNMSASHNFKVAVLTRDFKKMEEICRSTEFVDVNTTLIPLQLGTKEIVTVSPLLYAVYKQDIELLDVLLCKCHAIIFGKFDKAYAFASPFVQAYKSNNSTLISKIKEYALGCYKAILEGQVAMQEMVVGPTPEFEDIFHVANTVNKFTLEDHANIKQQTSITKDTLALLEYCSDQEVDQVLMMQDKTMTLTTYKQWGDIVNRIADAVEKEMKKNT